MDKFTQTYMKLIKRMNGKGLVSEQADLQARWDALFEKWKEMAKDYVDEGEDLDAAVREAAGCFFDDHTNAEEKAALMEKEGLSDEEAELKILEKLPQQEVLEYMGY